jgi:hypothetical protein
MPAPYAEIASLPLALGPFGGIALVIPPGLDFDS